jgi:hypothetical protein
MPSGFAGGLAIAATLMALQEPRSVDLMTKPLIKTAKGPRYSRLVTRPGGLVSVLSRLHRPHNLPHPLALDRGQLGQGAQMGVVAGWGRWRPRFCSAGFLAVALIATMLLEASQGGCRRLLLGFGAQSKSGSSLHMHRPLAPAVRSGLPRAVQPVRTVAPSPLLGLVAV